MPTVKHKTQLEILFDGLAQVRRHSGNMQKLATQECYYLRRIVSHLQMQKRFLMDRENLHARKIRRLQSQVKQYKILVEEMSRTRLTDSLNVGDTQ